MPTSIDTTTAATATATFPAWREDETARAFLRSVAGAALMLPAGLFELALYGDTDTVACTTRDSVELTPCVPNVDTFYLGRKRGEPTVDVSHVIKGVLHKDWTCGTLEEAVRVVQRIVEEEGFADEVSTPPAALTPSERARKRLKTVDAAGESVLES